MQGLESWLVMERPVDMYPGYWGHAQPLLLEWKDPNELCPAAVSYLFSSSVLV